MKNEVRYFFYHSLKDFYGNYSYSQVGNKMCALFCILDTVSYGAPIVSLFHMLDICSIYVEYPFYISIVCSVFQMFSTYFKYLFYISNIYSQFQIFVQYPRNLCYISNICSMLKWLYSRPSLFFTSISINIRSAFQIYVLILLRNIHPN